MDRVYEALIHWGDVFLLATPIRWGAASSLYYRMVEVAAFLIVGAQDNIAHSRGWND